MRDVLRNALAGPCVSVLVLTCGCTTRSLLPTPAIIEGWQYSELPESYDRDTLYQYINGKARPYLDYGFVKLDHVQFARPGGKPVIDLDVYDMGSRTGAFGIYSLERGDDLPRHYGKRLGYMVGSARFFWKGRHYVTITSPVASPNTIEAINSLSLYLENSLPGDARPPVLLAAFPTETRVHESEQYFALDLMGHEFMGGGFVVSYQHKANRFRLFLAQKESPDAAAEAFRQLKKSLSDHREIVGGVSDVGQSAFLARDSYLGRWLVSLSGNYVLGAVGFHDEQFARGLVAQLARNLSRSSASAGGMTGGRSPDVRRAPSSWPSLSEQENPISSLPLLCGPWSHLHC